MSRLRTPIVCVVIGEGSPVVPGHWCRRSLGDASVLNLLRYFPEGCANIIWKSSEFAPQAAEAMGVTSSTLEELGIVDTTIQEPLGCAHRDVEEMARRIRDHVSGQLDRLCTTDMDSLVESRYQRLMAYGSA